MNLTLPSYPDGVGSEFLLLENRAAAGNDVEGQAELFVSRVKHQPDREKLSLFDLTLPGPGDKPNADQGEAWRGVAGGEGA